MNMLVIADDFTGANDTGVQLAKKGVRTEVMLSHKQRPSRRARVLVINTESRALSPADAAAAIVAALATVTEGYPLIYKKIDSTFRGNIGAEIEAVMQAKGKTLALVAAAVPATGRTTWQGNCLVNEVLLDKTEYASDPKTPISCAHIRTIIGQQSQLPIHEIALERVRAGNLAATLADYQQQHRAILVLDAITDQDLSLIAQAAMSLHPLPLLVGAAGLANALPVHSWLTPQQALPVLLVAGSMSDVTRSQVNFVLRDPRVQVVDIDAGQLISPQAATYSAGLVQQAIQLLNEGKHCLLRTSRSKADRLQINELCQRQQISRQSLATQLSQQVGQLTLMIIESSRIGGLFLTGGDMAIAVANALNAQGYHIQAEVAPCIPCGNFINSEIDDLPVITKAGGFGSETILCDALAFIEEMYHEQ